MDIINGLVYVLLVGAVLGFVAWVLLKFAIPEPYKQILLGLIALIFGIVVVLFLLSIIGIGPGLRGPFLLR